MMILDAVRRLKESERPLTLVVIAPRILLATQLCSEFSEFIDNAHILHVHSGESDYYRTTNIDAIQRWNALLDGHKIIFTTYHSLNKVVDSGINIDVAYFDEAHNATQKSHFVGTAATSMVADSCYFFTATPRYSENPLSRGMNNTEIFGNTIISIPAPELVQNGSIIPPEIVPYQSDEVRTKENAATVDRNTILNIIDSLDDDKSSKVLVAAPSSAVLWQTVAGSDLLSQLQDRGYDVLHITSKFGAYINQQRVDRDQFFTTLTQWGKDKTRKFVILHYSILSEGINVPGLTHAVLLRQQSMIEMAQTIGRVIRVDSDDARDIATGQITPGDVESYRKPCGYVTVPVHGKSGVATARRLQNVVNTIFQQGQPAIGIF
jgi:superfamily II DNA or RNA helicase